MFALELVPMSLDAYIRACLLQVCESSLQFKAKPKSYSVLTNQNSNICYTTVQPEYLPLSDTIARTIQTLPCLPAYLDIHCQKM